MILLFQNTESLGEIKKSLSKYIIEKNEEKIIDSLDSELLDLVRELVKETDAMSDGKVKLFNDQIWKKIQQQNILMER